MRASSIRRSPAGFSPRLHPLWQTLSSYSLEYRLGRRMGEVGSFWVRFGTSFDVFLILTSELKVALIVSEKKCVVQEELSC